MKKISLAAAVLALSAGSAFAGDLPSMKSAPIAPIVINPWDFNVGATLTSDYLFRGITQSNHQPSVWGRAEVRYNVELVLAALCGRFGRVDQVHQQHLPRRQPGSRDRRYGWRSRRVRRFRL